MTDLDPATWGRRAADKDVLEAVLVQLAAMDLSSPVPAGGDDAAFLAAKRRRLEQIRDGLEGRR